jgi:hypothetical protein
MLIEYDKTMSGFLQDLAVLITSRAALLPSGQAQTTSVIPQTKQQHTSANTRRLKEWLRRSLPAKAATRF